MERDRALALQKAGLAAWIEAMSGSSPGARLYDRDGVIAIAAPACPDRSVVNSVSYTDAAALIGALDDLAAFFDDSGVVAWTVWAPEFDTEAIAALEESGSVLDGVPAAMSLDLSSWEPGEVGDLEWDDSVAPEDLGRINDAAYGLAPDVGLGRSLIGASERFHTRRAIVDGESACVLGTIDVGDDLGFFFVATDPRRRGLGLCSRLMTVALEEARQRGMTTSSLQGSKMGEPVYARLGFERDFALHMFERRKGREAGET